MNKTVFLLTTTLFACGNLFGGESLSFKCDRSSTDPLLLHCIVKNTSTSNVITILKAALAEDGAHTIYPDARYYMVAFFPEAEDGRRVEECVGKIFSGHTITDQESVVTLGPGQSHSFYRAIVSRNDELVNRLKTERFFIFWRISVRYTAVGQDNDHSRLESVHIGDYHGVIDSEGAKP